MDLLTKVTSIKRMPVIAPLSGGSVSALLLQWAPLISLTAAIIGIVLGILSYRLKKQQANMEMEYFMAKIENLKKRSNEANQHKSSI